MPTLKIPEHRSCVKIEAAVLGSPSLMLTVSVDVKQQSKLEIGLFCRLH